MSTVLCVLVRNQSGLRRNESGREELEKNPPLVKKKIDPPTEKSIEKSLFFPHPHPIDPPTPGLFIRRDSKRARAHREREREKGQRERTSLVSSIFRHWCCCCCCCCEKKGAGRRKRKQKHFLYLFFSKRPPFLPFCLLFQPPSPSPFPRLPLCTPSVPFSAKRSWILTSRNF